MTEKTNKSTNTTSADGTTKVDKDFAQAADTASQSPDLPEETPVVRRLVVPNSTSTSSDPEDDRSPGLVDRSAREVSEPDKEEN